MGVKYKYKVVKIKKTTKTIKLIKLLLNLSVISGIAATTSESKYIYVYPNLHFSKQICVLIKPTRQYFVKHKNITNLTTLFNTKTIYMTTSKGIISVCEATKYRIGGILFFKLI